MDFFIQDWKGFFREPKETFKRIATYESLTIPGVLLFICGIIMGFERYLKYNAFILKLENFAPRELTPHKYGMRDAEMVMAFLMPFIVLTAWLACSFACDLIAEKMGAIKGEMRDLLICFGYLSYPLLAYLIITFPLFYFGSVMKIVALEWLGGLLGFAFFLWLMYLASQVLEAISEIPMSHAFITLGITLALYLMFFYAFIELILNQMLLAGFFEGKYQ
ncbi:MAG: hypothetical protein RDV48_03135 [Candidatus Eremiobacteraeota bacterium]|nr:hypothetical protein [Candidatus Eremiobacteraeota bacterium]